MTPVDSGTPVGYDCGAMTLDRITFDPQIMGGKPCVRGMRMPVSVVLKLMAGGMSKQQILDDYPYLQAEDIDQCMQYAALLADERYLPQAG
jgi:uncharacterized protein (DUF433 family)